MPKDTATRLHPEGSQSIGRAAEVLALVSSRSEAGSRLSDVAEATGLHVATARRIMQALVSEGLLAFDRKSKLYVVGPAIFSFAVQGSPWFARRELFVPVLEDIARRTSDTVLFSIKSGFEAVCLARREGAFPIRVMSLNTGSRRPLGAGSGSLAILAFLSDAEQAEAVRHCARSYGPFGLAAEDVTAMAADARRQGFAFNPGRIIDGVHGVGVPILSHGAAVASVSVAAIKSRMAPARCAEIVGIICDALAAIAEVELPPSLVLPSRQDVTRSA